MPVTFAYEYMGITTVRPGETVEMGWELFPGEFPPLIDHSFFSVGGPGGYRTFLDVHPTVVEGPEPGPRAFFYSVQNPNPGYAFMFTDFIFPKRG